jgi:large subunit ribosomal protein L28
LNFFLYYDSIAQLSKYINNLSAKLETRKSMAKICPITKKGSIMGGGYSNATRATQFNPTGKVRKFINLQKKRIYIPELKKTVILKISTKALKTIQKNGAYVTLKKAKLI